MIRRSLALSAFLLAVLWAGAAHATAAGSLWDLSGTVTARVGPFSESAPATGMLALNADRTYVFHIDGDDVADMGAWFELKGKLLLFSQNLLEVIVDIEEDLETELGEPVEVTPIKGKSKVRINQKTGLIEIRADSAYQVFLPQSNVTLKVTLRAAFTGTRV